MSNSTKLSNTQQNNGGGKSIFNPEAKELEGNLAEQVQELLIFLKGQYPEIKFTFKKKLYKKEIAKSVGKKNWIPCSDNPYISPDGGIIYAQIFGKLYPILVCEAKKQGTNDIIEFIKSAAESSKTIEYIVEKTGWTNNRICNLISKGVYKKQAKGNAIERAFKNYLELRLYFSQYDYFPYTIFASGCDFEETSSINDRLDSMTEYEPRNVEYTFHPNSLATIWIKESHWTKMEIYDKIKNTAVNVLTHILSYE